MYRVRKHNGHIKKVTVIGKTEEFVVIKCFGIVSKKPITDLFFETFEEAKDKSIEILTKIVNAMYQELIYAREELAECIFLEEEDVKILPGEKQEYEDEDDKP